MIIFARDHVPSPSQILQDRIGNDNANLAFVYLAYVLGPEFRPRPLTPSSTLPPLSQDATWRPTFLFFFGFFLFWRVMRAEKNKFAASAAATAVQSKSN
jgi:hypothetical protein